MSFDCRICTIPWQRIFIQFFVFLMINFSTINVNPHITKVTLDRFIIISNFKCAYPTWIMFSHIEVLDTLVIKVSNEVRKNIKITYILMNKERQNQTRALSQLSVQIFLLILVSLLLWLLVFVSCARSISGGPSHFISLKNTRKPQATATLPKWDHHWLCHICYLPNDLITHPLVT